MPAPTTTPAPAAQEPAWKKAIEKDADGDIQTSIAISLAKLADAYQRQLGLK